MTDYYCTPCPDHQYSTVEAAQSCTDCPDGSSTAHIDYSCWTLGEDCADELTDCKCQEAYTGPDGGPCTLLPTSCPDGYYQHTPFVFDSVESSCSLCDPGTWKTESYDAYTCQNCDAGKYSTSTGATSMDTCLNCPLGSSSLAGSGALTDCECQTLNEYDGGPDGGPCTCSDVAEPFYINTDYVAHTDKTCASSIMHDGYTEPECKSWCDIHTTCFGYSYSDVYTQCQTCQSTALSYYPTYTTYLSNADVKTCKYCPYTRSCINGECTHNTDFTSDGTKCVCQPGFELHDNLKAYDAPQEMKSCDPYTNVIDPLNDDCRSECDSRSDCKGYFTAGSLTGGYGDCRICLGTSIYTWTTKTLYMVTDFHFKECIACTSGKYSEDGVACVGCPANTVSSEPTQITDCVCSPGYTGPDGGPCEVCAHGKYKETPGTSLCLDCADGYVSSEDRSSCEACPNDEYEYLDTCLPCPENSGSIGSESAETVCACNAGYQGFSGPDDRTCTECPVGKYKHFQNFDECFDCGAGFGSTGKPYAPWSEACEPCSSGSFEMNGMCHLCAHGKYSDHLYTNTECVWCEPGFFPIDVYDNYVTLGAKDCQPCAPGTYSTEPASPCTTCDVGLFTLSFGMTHCETCAVLNDDKTTYDSSTGECACVPGYFFNPNAASAVEQRCASNPCPADTYKADVGNQECTVCSDSGYVDAVNYAADSAEVTLSRTAVSYTLPPDEVHQYWEITLTSVPGATAQSQCVCPPANVPRLDGLQVYCDACPLGFYQEEDQWIQPAAHCTQCPYAQSTFDLAFIQENRHAYNNATQRVANGGQYLPTFYGYHLAAGYANSGSTSIFEIAHWGAFSSEQCSYCPSNYYAAGRPSLTNYPHDHYEDYRSTIRPYMAPLPLSQNYYGVMCIPCPKHSCCNPLPADSISGCQCNPGYYRSQASDATSCVPCPVGTFKSTPGNTAEECTECPAGYYQPLEAQTEASACVLSPVNTFSARGSSAYSTCPEASHALAGSASLLDCLCLPGFFGTDEGTSYFACTRCDLDGYAGFKNESGNTHCTVCPIGYGYGTLSCTRHFHADGHIEVHEADALGDCDEFVLWSEAHQLAHDHPDLLDAANTYVPDSRDACEPCPDDTFSPTQQLQTGNWLFGRQLTAPVAVSGFTCNACPEGKTTHGLTAQTSCSCPQGSYPLPQFWTPFSYNVDGSYNAGPYCDICREGFVLDFSIEYEQKCRQCPDGHVSQRQHRNRSPTECFPCPAGTYREYVYARLCFNGTDDTRCKHFKGCSVGTESCETATSYPACIQCPVGSTSPPGSEGLHSCQCQVDGSVPQNNVWESATWAEQYDGWNCTGIWDLDKDRHCTFDTLSTDECPTCASSSCPDGEYRVGCDDATFTPGVCTACNATAQCHNALGHFAVSKYDETVADATLFTDAEHAASTSLAREFWGDNYFLYGCHGLYAGNCYTCQYRYMWTATWVIYNGSWSAGMTYIPGYTDEQGMHPDYYNWNPCRDIPLDVEEQKTTYYMSECGGLDGGQCTECAACPAGQFRAGCNNGSPGECLSCAERAAICDRVSCSRTENANFEAWNSTSNSTYLYSMSPEACLETNTIFYLSNCGSFNYVQADYSRIGHLVRRTYADDVENAHYQLMRDGASRVTYGGVCQECADCPAGQFRDGCDDQYAGFCSYCVSCARNEYRIRCRGAYAGECHGCESCGAGNCRQNCGGDTPDSNGTCISCEQKALQCADGEYLAGCGQFTVDGTTFPSQVECGSCTPCRACNSGFVTTECGGQDAGKCVCPPGNSIVYGATPSEDVCVPCAANYYQNETLVYGKMPTGSDHPEFFDQTPRSQEFMNEVNMYAQCTPCYFNRVSPPGATSSDQCVCPTDFVSVRDVVWNVTNIETIDGIRTTTPAELSLSLLCVCPAGFQIEDDESSPLRCMWARQPEFITFPNGTSVADPNAGQIMYNYCAYDGIPEGDLGFVHSNGILKNHHPGLSLEDSQHFAWSMATCVACVHGTYSTADKFVDGRQDRCLSCLTRAYQCRPDLDTMNSGYKWLDGCNATHAGECRDCEACAEGSFRIGCDNDDPGFCGTCPDGYWYNEFYRHCQHCEANPCMWGAKRSRCGGNSMGTCACPPGTYRTASPDVTVSHASGCESCPAATYNPLWNQPQCLSCQTAVSLSTSAPGSASSEDCVCPAPMAIDVTWQEVTGEDRCACGRGRYMVETATGFACADAESGTYQPFFHAAEALPCPVGCDSPPLSTSVDDCVCRNGRRRLYGFIETYNFTSARRLLAVPGFDAPADALERYHRVSVVDRVFVCACPLGTYSSSCLPCPACEPGFYRTGCGIKANATVISAAELAAQLASNGSCVPCEACEQADDAGPFMRVGCLHHAGHNDAAGECKSRSLLVRTPWCPADRGVPPVSLGGFTYADVFHAEYDTVNFLCSRPCDGRGDIDLGRCDGPFACNTLTCMSEAADRSVFPAPPVFACPVRMTDAEHTLSTAATPTDVRTLKRQQRCVACSDCGYTNTQDAAHFDYWGAGCARECSSLLCPTDKIWDWTARACRFCEELSDARLCSTADLDSNDLNGRDVTGNLPLIRFSQCLPARWGMHAAYGTCRLCETLTCAADEYQATCLPQLVAGAYDPGSSRVSALATSPCRFCDLRREPAAAIFRQQYLHIDGSTAILSCQISACRPRDGVAMTGMRNYGPVCTHACQTLSCPSGSVFVPCALPLQAYCRPLFSVDAADRTAPAALLDEANFLAEPLSFRGADGAIRRHGFASFENAFVNTLSDTVHHQHQCVWNAAGITDSEHLPGGISQVFWPPAYAYAEVFEARGTKFCRQWSRADGVTYPLLPLQNTVALSCLDVVDCSISAEARRVFADTPARAASYAFSGESGLSDFSFSSDVSIHPPQAAPAADVGGAGQLYLLLDASNAPRVSVSVHVPDDRGLEQAPWLRAFLFTFLAADATLPDPNASPAPLSATASVHADETFGASNCLSVDHVDPRFLAPRSFDTLFQARLAPDVYGHVQDWRARGTEAVEHTLHMLSDAHGSSTPMRVVRRDASAARIVVQVAPAVVLDLDHAMSDSYGVYPGLYAHRDSMANWKLNPEPNDLFFTFRAAVLPVAFQLRQAAWPAVQLYWSTPHRLLCPVLLASASQLLCAHMQGVEDVTPAIDERQILGPVAKIGTTHDEGLLVLVRPLTATGIDMRTATLMARWDIRLPRFTVRDSTWRRTAAPFASRVLAMAAFPDELWALEYAAPALHIVVHPVAFPTDHTVQPSFVPTFGAERASAAVELPVDVLPDPASTAWLHHCRIEVRQYTWPPQQAVVACALPDAATNQLLLAVVAYSFTHTADASNTSAATLVVHARAHVALPGAAAEYTPAFLSLYAINDNFWALAAHGLVFQFDTRAHGGLRRVPSVLDGMHIVRVAHTVLFTLADSTINVTTFLRDCVELPPAVLDVVTTHGFSIFSVGDGADVVYSRQGFPLDRSGNPLVLPPDTFADPRYWRDLLFAADPRHVSMPLAIVQPDGTNTSLRDAALQIDLQPARRNGTSESLHLPVLLKLRVPPTASVHFMELLGNGSSVPRLKVLNAADADSFRVVLLQDTAIDIYEPDPQAPRVHLPVVHAIHLFGAEIVACNFLHFVPSAHEIHGALAILQAAPTTAVSAFTRAHALSATWQRVRRLYPGAIAAHSRLSVDFHRVGTPEQLRQHATIALDDLQLLPVLSHVPCARHDSSLRTVLYVPSAADLIVLGMPAALESPADWARLYATAAVDLDVAAETSCRFRVALFHVDSDGLPVRDIEDDNLHRMGCDLRPAGAYAECLLEIPLSAPHVQVRWVGAELTWDSPSCAVSDLHAFFLFIRPFQPLLRCPPEHFFDAALAACVPCNTLQTAIHCPIGQRLPGCPALQHDTACVVCTDGFAEVAAGRAEYLPTATSNASCAWQCRPGFFRDGETCAPCTATLRCAAGFYRESCTVQLPERCVACTPLEEIHGEFARYERFVANCSTECVASAYRSARGSCHRCWTREELLVSALTTSLPDTSHAAGSRFYRFHSCSANANAAARLCVPRNGSRITAHAADFDTDCPRECGEGWHDTVAGCQQCPPVLNPSGHALAHARAFDYLQDCAVHCRAPYVNASARGESGDCVLCNATCPVGQYLAGAACDECRNCSSSHSDPRFHFTSAGVLDDPRSCVEHCRPGFYNRFALGVCHAHATPTCLPGFFLRPGTHAQDAACVPCGVCPGQRVARPCNTSANAVCASCGDAPPRARFVDEPARCTLVCDDGFVLNHRLALCEPCTVACPLGTYSPPPDVRANCSDCHPCTPKPAASVWVENTAGDRVRAACAWRCRAGHTLTSGACVATAPSYPPELSTNYVLRCSPGYTLDSTFQCVSCLSDKLDMQIPDIAKLGSTWTWRAVGAPCAWYCLPGLHPYRRGPSVIHCLSYAQRRYAAVDGAASADTQLTPIVSAPALVAPQSTPTQSTPTQSTPTQSTADEQLERSMLGIALATVVGVAFVALSLLCCFALARCWRRIEQRDAAPVSISSVRN